MKYKELKQDDFFRCADVLNLYWAETGEEIPDDIPEETLDEMEVTEWTAQGGWLTITLREGKQ